MTDGMTARSTALRFTAGERLPWPLAALLIGGLSVGLWLVLWQVAQRVLAG